MSNQLHLYVTNLPSAQAAFDDECEDGDLQKPLLEVPGDIIALLWIPMFKDVVWQAVLDKEQWEEADEDDAKDDFILSMPLVEITQAVANLRAAEANLSEFFKENGGVKHLVDELVAVLESSDFKYVYFNPACGDFCYSSEERELVDEILGIASGDFSKKKEDIAAMFGIQLNSKSLFSSKPITFKSSKEFFSNNSKYNAVDELNLYRLVGLLR